MAERSNTICTKLEINNNKKQNKKGLGKISYTKYVIKNHRQLSYSIIGTITKVNDKHDAGNNVFQRL